LKLKSEALEANSYCKGWVIKMLNGLKSRGIKIERPHVWKWRIGSRPHLFLIRSCSASI